MNPCEILQRHWNYLAEIKKTNSDSWEWHRNSSKKTPRK